MYLEVTIDMYLEVTIDMYLKVAATDEALIVAGEEPAEMNILRPCSDSPGVESECLIWDWR